jgi:hypothetical protein
MTLTAKDHRCPGRGHDGPGGVLHAPECADCLRREFPAGVLLWIIEPPEESPCPERRVE